ncbi:peptidase S28 [Cubamyces sp. BRFM 1775]|nr:peptidase S28 [Cubamyces sp. BRFM 1775]
MTALRFLVPLLLSAWAYAGPSMWGNSRHGVPIPDVESYEVKHKMTGEALPSLDTVYYFDQLIDHDDPSLGTFQQRYWMSYNYYQPGGPILLMNAGEQDASALIGYLTTTTITGYLAEKLNGTVVLLEHRFFGQSNPYPDLTTKSLRVLTVQQAIDDHEYFVKNVQLPMPGGDQLGPDKAPWILFGGSYPGALTSYTMYNKPGLFAAGYASSAVVEATSDFWNYYEPTREYMPQNCSADVQAAIAYVDEVIESGNATAIQALKENFGLGELTHDDDFEWALATVIQTWQDLLLSSGRGQTFNKFCLAIATKDGEIAGPDGWGAEHAISAWGAFYLNGPFLPSRCGSIYDSDEGRAACFNTYNPYAYTATNVNNWARSWMWLLCNEFGFWQVGAPATSPALVSRLITPAYWERQCTYYFPEVFSSPPDTSAAASRTNQKYGGWNVSTERLIFLNGVRDPWREVTVAAAASPNGGSDLQPHLLGDGYHCSDMLISEGNLSSLVNAEQQQTLQYFAQWLADWKPTSA